MSQKFIRLPEVLEKTGVQKTFIWDGIKKGTFPAQIKIARRVAVWLESEVDQWISDQVIKARGEA